MWRWADQCEFEHDTSRQKTDGTWVGQNLYLHGSSNQYTYEEVRHRAYCHFGARIWNLLFIFRGFSIQNLTVFS